MPPLVRHLHAHIIHVAYNHDDWTWFRIWFAIATVTASIVLNLGIFTLLVSIHMALDVVKYRSRHDLSWLSTIVETLREGLVDIFFIVLGLLLGIALHHAVAIGGLGKMARLEVMLIDLVLRIGPRLKIAEHLLEVVLYWRHHYEEQFQPRAPLSRPEKVMFFATLTCVASILIIPLTTSLTLHDIGERMKHELTPRLELSISKTIGDLEL
jgi:hypothetical protein